MRVKEIIRAAKTITNAGKWTTGKRMPASIFPLTKGHALRVGPNFRWRVVEFACANSTFRLLIFYRPGHGEYRAYLGRVEDADTRVIVRLEYHSTHPGWHVHTDCDTEMTPCGRIGGAACHKRLSSSRMQQTPPAVASDVDDEMAYRIAIRWFRLDRTADADLL